MQSSILVIAQMKDVIDVLVELACQEHLYHVLSPGMEQNDNN